MAEQQRRTYAGTKDSDILLGLIMRIHRLSVESVAQDIGVTRAALHMYLNRETRPNEARGKRLEARFGIPVSRLLAPVDLSEIVVLTAPKTHVDCKCGRKVRVL